MALHPAKSKNYVPHLASSLGKSHLKRKQIPPLPQQLAPATAVGRRLMLGLGQVSGEFRLLGTGLLAPRTAQRCKLDPGESVYTFGLLTVASNPTHIHQSGKPRTSTKLGGLRCVPELGRVVGSMGEVVHGCVCVCQHKGPKRLAGVPLDVPFKLTSNSVPSTNNTQVEPPEHNSKIGCSELFLPPAAPACNGRKANPGSGALAAGSGEVPLGCSLGLFAKIGSP